MTGRLRKSLLKLADVFTSIPFDEHFWEKNNFQPLILTIIHPFLSRSPWKLKSAKFARECEGNLQRIWSDNFLLGGNLLRKLSSVPRSLESMSGSMFREVL